MVETTKGNLSRPPRFPSVICQMAKKQIKGLQLGQRENSYVAEAIRHCADFFSLLRQMCMWKLIILLYHTLQTATAPTAWLDVRHKCSPPTRPAADLLNMLGHLALFHKDLWRFHKVICFVWSSSDLKTILHIMFKKKSHDITRGGITDLLRFQKRETICKNQTTPKLRVI